MLAYKTVQERIMEITFFISENYLAVIFRTVDNSHIFRRQKYAKEDIHTTFAKAEIKQNT